MNDSDIHNCVILGVTGWGQSKLEALVMCIVAHDELREADAAEVVRCASDKANEHHLNWDEVLAAVELEIQAGQVVTLLRGHKMGDTVDAECTHPNICYVAQSTDVEHHGIVVDVVCNSCDRSGSALLTSKDVLW